MRPAITIPLKKRNKAGTWNLQAKHPGQVYLETEKAGLPGRWNTLRALGSLFQSEVKRANRMVNLWPVPELH
jgi:hypothetical protein